MRLSWVTCTLQERRYRQNELISSKLSNRSGLEFFHGGLNENMDVSTFKKPDIDF